MAQNDKKTLSGYLRTHTSYDLHLWYTYEKGYLVAFFTFSPNFNFWGQCCGKRGKMAQIDKKLCLLHSISQEAYIILLWFSVHLCKMMASPDAFICFFKILIFVVVRGGGGQGNTLWTSTKILQKIMAFQKLAQTFWSISCLFFKIILWNFRKTCYHGTDIANTICRFFLFGEP